MDSTRQKKFAKEMQRELSQILQREVEPGTGALITLNHVRVSPDLGLVKAYITAFPDKMVKPILAMLNEEKGKIRQLLAARIRHQVRTVPDVDFYYDDTLEQASRLDRLFDQIRQDEQAGPGSPDAPID